MKLRCPKCGKIAEWAGYPNDPKLSLVLCLGCGYARPGAAFKRIEAERQQERAALLDGKLWAVKQVSAGVFSVREVYPGKSEARMVYHYKSGLVTCETCLPANEGERRWGGRCEHRKAVEIYLAKTSAGSVEPGDKLQVWPQRKEE